MPQTYQDYELTDAQADRIGKLRIRNLITIERKDSNGYVLLCIEHGDEPYRLKWLDTNGRLV